MTLVSNGSDGGSNQLGFFNIGPASQQGAVGNEDFTQVGGDASNQVYVGSTFTGGSGTAYTIGDIVRALKSYGLLQS